jgi:RNA polymerase sigma-70 factor, ECF subfamily
VRFLTARLPIQERTTAKSSGYGCLIKILMFNQPQSFVLRHLPPKLLVTFRLFDNSITMNDAPLGFHELYSRYAADVRRFAFWLCGDADDITAETFVRVWAAYDRVRMATVKGYLFTIARNLFLQARQRAQRQVELSDDLATTTPSPVEISEQRTELARVIRALQTLPEIDRAALILRVETRRCFNQSGGRDEGVTDDSSFAASPWDLHGAEHLFQRADHGLWKFWR